MLWKASEINGYAIAASDGRLGTISDFLFDDASWLVRWLVVDTGRWLFGRKVLLSPSVLGQLYPKGEKFSVKLTMQQVKDSPDIDTDLPVSRQMETSIYDYYGWSPYSGTSLYTGGYGYLDCATAPSPSIGPPQLEQNIVDTLRSVGDQHLRSVATVTGYRVHARDGEIGHVEDFLVDDADWSIHYLVADTKNWWPGKKVLISPRSAKEIDWAAKMVNLDVSRQQVKDSPAYENSTTVDLAYEKHFHNHYGDSRPMAPSTGHPPLSPP